LLRSGGGYTDARIQKDVFLVSFLGNGYTSMQTAQRFALLRCAEICLQNGFKFFVIIDDGSDVLRTSVKTPVQVQTTGNLVGNTYSESTHVSGGYSIPLAFPNASFRIKCFLEKPEGVESYDAAEVKLFAKK